MERKDRRYVSGRSPAGSAGRQSSYGNAGRQNSYGSAGRQNSYGNAGRQSSYGNAGRQNSYGSAGRQNSYGNAGRQNSYGNAGRQNSRGSTGNQRAYGGGRGKNARQIPRRKKRGSRGILYGCIIAFLVLLIACGAGTWLLYRQSGRQSEAPQVTVDLDALDSPCAVLIDAATGTVMGSKNSDTVIYPASMVKVMTVLTAIQSIRDLDETVTMSYDYYETLYARDASRAGFEPGEEAVIRDLLYGALLPSGAECCMELSIQATGSEEAFVELMNQNAEALGLSQTHFSNCTGLHDENQYTTPLEMAEILREALQNSTFYQVFTTPSYTVGATSIHPDGFTFQSSMFKNMNDSTVINGEILGGKTGYTDEAGHCLASMAEVGGRQYILVTAGWAENPRTSQYHINDAFLAYNALGRSIGEA